MEATMKQDDVGPAIQVTDDSTSNIIEHEAVIVDEKPIERHDEHLPLVREDDISKTNDDRKRIGIDEYLVHVGQFGRCQILLLSLFVLLIMSSTYQTLIMGFIGNIPTWRCVVDQQQLQHQNISSVVASVVHTNKTCRFKTDIGPDDENYNERCKMNRSLWTFTKPKEYSIVTEWDLVCDEEYLSYLANSALFIGWACGSLVFGWISDRYGRKKALFSSWTLLVLTAFGSAFANHISVFIVLRVLIGFCQGGMLTLFVMATELVGPKHRSLAGTAVWIGFTFALCLLGLQAYLVPKWRMLEMITSIPYIILVVSYKFVPESVRWLHVNNRVKEATKILKKVAKVNKVEITERIELSVAPEGKRDEKKASFLDMFIPASTGISTVILAIAWFVNGQVYYGISLASVQLGGNMYLNFVLTSLVELPANLISIYTTNRFGRKASVIYSLFAGGLACIAVAFIPTKTPVLTATRVTLGILGKLCISHSFNGTTIWSVELFPTVMRAQAMGVLTVVSRVGAATAPWIGQYLQTIHKVLPFTIMGGSALISAVLCIRLQETLGNATAETLEQMSEEKAKKNLQIKNKICPDEEEKEEDQMESGQRDCETT